MSASTALGAYILAACGRGDSSDSEGRLAIGTPDDPVEQPLFDDIPAIDSGLEPETGPLLIYNWVDYINEETVQAFADEYGVEYELTTFYNSDESLRKLSTGELEADIFFPTDVTLAQFTAGKLLQPLNREYIPNLEANVWSWLTDPYYDRGSRYTVPYTVYTTGFAWRTDQVDIDPAELDNAWSVFWDPAHAGRTGIYDEYREAIITALFRNGVLDVNTSDPEALQAAQESLAELVDLMNIRYTIDGTYLKLPEGEFGLHQAWSGDAVNAQYYFPEGEDPSVLRYWWPPREGNGGGLIANDTMAVPSNAPHPVLAHHFIDFMLREDRALENFTYTGYQPPQNGIDPDSLLADEYVAPDLASAVVRQEDFELDEAQVAITLAPEVDEQWRQVWAAARSGG